MSDTKQTNVPAAQPSQPAPSPPPMPPPPAPSTSEEFQKNDPNHSTLRK